MKRQAEKHPQGKHPRIRRILTAVIILLVIAAVSLPVSSHLVWHRSAKATLVEIYRRSHYDGRFDTAEAAEEWMARRTAAEDRAFALPDGNYESAVSVREICGRQTVVFDGTESGEAAADGALSDTAAEQPEPAPLILYLHGGAYVGGINRYHLDLCDRLAARTRAVVLMPDYPLAPNHIWSETYAFLDELWTETAEATGAGPLILMGDSAGGGLAAAFCEHLAEERVLSSQAPPPMSLRLPDQLILFSPWVDVSMSGDYSALLPADPSLAPEGLAACGAAWAGGTDPADRRISPLFGFMVGLPRTTIFVGTREILYPDILDFYERLTAADVDAALIVGEGMNHDYPLYPIPEADAALETVVRTIR